MVHHVARYMNMVRVPSSVHIGVIGSIYIDSVYTNVSELGGSCGVQEKGLEVTGGSS